MMNSQDDSPEPQSSPTPPAPASTPQPAPIPAREGPVPTLLPGPGEQRQDGADPLPRVTNASKEK
jgi:hypothetical protein